MTLLQDGEWGKWSDREIARRCSVDHKTVSGLRQELSGEIPQINRKVTRNGRTYTMNTANIGKGGDEPLDEDEANRGRNGHAEGYFL